MGRVAPRAAGVVGRVLVHAGARGATRPTNLLAIQALIFFIAILITANSPAADTLSRADWGAPDVAVSHTGHNWIITGKKQIVTLDEKSLALEVNARSVIWKMPADPANDMVAKSGGAEFPLHLSDAKNISVEPYDTGFKTGVKITLAGWQSPADKDLDLKLYLTVCLQGDNDELVFDTAAHEGEAVLRQLDWPPALDARDVDDTVLSNNKGNLLPRNWPKPYYPIRSTDTNGMGTAKKSDHSIIQSHVIEDWSRSWWGFEQGKSAMMLIVETPDDAAYQFDHPAGMAPRSSVRAG